MVSLAPVSSTASASQYDFECLTISCGPDVDPRRLHVLYRYPSNAFLRAYHSCGAAGVVVVDAVDASNATDSLRIGASGLAAVAVSEPGTDSTKVAVVVEEGSQPVVKESGPSIQVAAAVVVVDSGRAPGSEVVAVADTASVVVEGSNDPGTGAAERTVWTLVPVIVVVSRTDPVGLSLRHSQRYYFESTPATMSSCNQIHLKELNQTAA